ncbi:MAG: bifunctional diaminohydroxyphosphoribosylaminopyrimidine deaminase/5-amino-6-(5-phosphoribosylamino)uracil reductase RibD [Actinobacteria bacterium]|nr:bifunctional diaminohydroxyphosphoribosylaminopyrimidine deaminase/5-amino-6-(5-phosphoribosylamino)uracil reductase RibD [Actinomycetota bacterium]
MSENFSANDRECMARAIAAAAQVRCATSPNPWVGAVIRGSDQQIYEGATMEPGKSHAEVVALRAAGAAARGGTAYVTLEPCSHTGRTAPCVDALIEAGIARVVVALEDPDERVNGNGIAALRAAGIDVEVGLYAERVRVQLAPYIKHRTTGRPYVVLKLASSVDGATAAPDGSSQWITCPAARADGHRIRAESDAIIVGAGTVRRDNPSLTVRDYKPPVLPESGSVDPLRVILGGAAADAKVQPCREMRGELTDILDELGRDGVLQVLVEGGAAVAGDFHRAGLVDKYVLYIAPALFGGGDARGLFTGLGAYSIDDVWRGRFDAVERVGVDLRLELCPISDEERS